MYTKIPKILNIALYIVLGGMAFWISIRYLLPWLAPFIVALGIAALLEPAVGYMCRRLRFPRALASGLCVIVFLFLAFEILFVLFSQIMTELRAFVERLPDIINSVSTTIDSWKAALGSYIDTAPAGLSAWMSGAVKGVTDQIQNLPGWLSGKLPGIVSAFASAAPSVLLFTVTSVIGAYFISASYPSIIRFVKNQIPERFRDKARAVQADLRRTIGKWFKAQMIMMLITFVELTIAFLLLRINYALLLALVTSIIDALPVLGAGTVLIPWAVYDLLTGSIAEAIGLFITYGAVTVLRNCIQAKLLGDQLGLHPIATLLSIYVGYKVWGVWGMIIFPIIAISLKQLNDSGVIRLWKTEDKGENDSGNNIQHHSGNGNEHTGRHEYPPR